MSCVFLLIKAAGTIFQLFKKSGVHFQSKVLAFGDKGYQGLEKLHKYSLIPIKASKKHKLSPDEKA